MDLYGYFIINYLSEIWIMRKKWIYALMGLISTLLIALIIIQMFWLNSASVAEKRETRLHIEKALARVDEQLRNVNYCVLIYGKTFVNPGDKFYMVQADSTGRIDTLSMFVQSNYVESEEGRTRVLAAPFPFSMDIQLKSAAVINNVEGYYKERKAYYEKMTGKKYKDIIATAEPIDSVFDMQMVDSLIRANLRIENIDTNYSFAFIDKNAAKVSFSKRSGDSSAFLTSPYSLQLFTDNKFIKPYNLSLLFSHMPGTYGINSWLWFSFVAVILLIFSFYAFVRLYIKQTRLSEMKSDFIHNLTHEFNTPMANIALAIETLEGNGKPIDSKVSGILNIISAESSRLRDNIERSLQIATLERGNLQLHRESIDLVQTINTLLAAYQLQCNQLGGKISFSHPKGVIIRADETHILNCIVNLLDNAIKYRNGPPCISIDIKDEGGEVVITVTDNGKGMSSETQKHIFEKFYRAHEGDTHNTKGFGLGLSYVKGIIEAHKGKIDVWSKPGTGTKFTIKLPKSLSYAN